ncbi:MAG TPA: HmuY family protein [Chitinophagaceae bacterium]|nr:HmuY family protein [Chitinophagaceae bacterium]
MKKTFLSLMTIAALTGIVFLTSCDKNNDVTSQPTHADTAIVVVNFNSGTPFTLFSFKNKAAVSNTDSVSNKWDFALRLTTFLVNSNASGPGNAGVIMQDGIFDNITSAPASGYAYDTAAGKLAIKDGSWYNYNITTHVFTPTPGKIFIFRTADNHYAKMEILGVTYEPFTGPVPQKIDYKIRFAYQADGTGNF